MRDTVLNSTERWWANTCHHAGGPEPGPDHPGTSAGSDDAEKVESSNSDARETIMDEGEPISYLALATKTPVLSSSGSEFGTVVHVLQIPELDEFDGIVVATKGGHRFVDRDQNLRDNDHVRALRALG